MTSGGQMFLIYLMIPFVLSGQYVPVSTCPELAQYVIEKKSLPKAEIHECVSKPFSEPGGENYEEISISYGQEQDCPAGCFYNGMKVIVHRRSRRIFGVIDKRPNSILSAGISTLDERRIDKKCEPRLLDSIVEVSFLERAQGIGWRMKFKEPYRCYYWENTFTQVLDDGISTLNKGFEVTRIWEGEATVIDNGRQKVWDISKITTREVERKPAEKRRTPNH